MKCLCLSVYAAFFALSASAQAKPMPALNTLQDKIYVLSHSWAEIKYNFVNIDRISFDIDSLYFATLDRVLKTENDVDFYREVRRFFAAFGDGHTQLLRTNYRERDYVEDIPASIGQWDGRYYFTSIKRNAGLDHELLGAEIVSIDGVPVAEYVKKNCFPEIAESTEARRKMKAAGVMQQGEPGTFFRGTARTLAGRSVDFEIPFNFWATRSDDDRWWSYPTERKPRYGLRFEGDVAILHMSDLGEDMLPRVDSRMRVARARKPDRPLFIGEETGGSTGAPLVIHFPHGAYARICTLRPLFPYSGKPFAGRGIAPDIEVKATFEDSRSGKDAAMERALAVFKQDMLN